jgi:hypothetical protein
MKIFENGQEFWKKAKRVLKNSFFVHFYFLQITLFCVFSEKLPYHKYFCNFCFCDHHLGYFSISNVAIVTNFEAFFEILLR